MEDLPVINNNKRLHGTLVASLGNLCKLFNNPMHLLHEKHCMIYGEKEKMLDRNLCTIVFADVAELSGICNPNVNSKTCIFIPTKSMKI